MPVDPPTDTVLPIADLLDGAIELKQNPHGRAPLTATASVRTQVPTQISIEVLGDVPLGHDFDALALQHDVPVLGLYPGRENLVVVKVTDPERGYGLDTLRVTTPALPDFFPTVRILTANTAQMEPGLTFSALRVGDNGTRRPYPLAFDAAGEVRWYMDLTDFGEPVITVERLRNGHFTAGDSEVIYAFDMLGREANQWAVPGYNVHHDIIELPNGNLVAAVDKLSEPTIEDHMVEIDRTSGAIVTEWDFREILDVDRFDVAGHTRDWFHQNAVWYDERDDTFILSGRQQGVVKVTRSNELVWIFAAHRGWGPAGPEGDGFETSDYLLTAVDAGGAPYPDAVQDGEEDGGTFNWPWTQHAPMVLENGNLFLFDNGHNRWFSESSPAFSRGAEYVLDEEAKTVRQVQAFGRERGTSFYSWIVSDVDELAMTGNRLIMPGIVRDGSPHYSVVAELTPGIQQVVFEAKLEFKNLLGNGSGPGQFDLVYRSERLPLYPDGDLLVPTASPHTPFARLSR